MKNLQRLLGAVLTGVFTIAVLLLAEIIWPNYLTNFGWTGYLLTGLVAFISACAADFLVGNKKFSK